MHAYCDEPQADLARRGSVRPVVPPPRSSVSGELARAGATAGKARRSSAYTEYRPTAVAMEDSSELRRRTDVSGLQSGREN